MKKRGKFLDDELNKIIVIAGFIVLSLVVLAFYKNLTGKAIEDVGVVCEGIVDAGDLSGCTRTRFGTLAPGIDKIPSAGVRVINNDYYANTTGASYGRNIIQWYDMYDGSGNLNFTNLDSIMEGHKNAGMKLILTLRSNDPNKSEVGFDTSIRTILQPDSYPKSESNWTDYLKNVTYRYYANATENVSGVLLAIQIGNEWSHQFEINETRGVWNSSMEELAMLNLMNISYSAIKNVSTTIPVIMFAVTGVTNVALKAGFNEAGWKYAGNYYINNRSGISIIDEGDLNINLVAAFQRAVVNGSPFYDYFDSHIYFQDPEEARYAANLIRSIWIDNGITGKGLISTEFADPIYNFSYDLHSYNIKTAQAVAYHSGFDSIVWANWNPAQANPNILQTSFKICALIDSSCYRSKQINNYTYMQNISKDFINVTRNSDLFTFSNASTNNQINISIGVPVYPGLYQCSDGIDNDYDGLIDSLDNECYVGYCNGTQNVNDPNCVDPEGFSEENWIFTYPDSLDYPDIEILNITILHPINGSVHSSSSIDFNYTSENADSCWYNINDGNNNTIASCLNMTLSLSNGYYNLTLFGNNTNFIGEDRVSFSVSISSGGQSGGGGSGGGGSGGSSSSGSSSSSISESKNETQDSGIFLSPDDSDNKCSPEWECEWSGCAEGKQTASCKDVNNCRVEYNGVKERSCESNFWTGKTIIILAGAFVVGVLAAIFIGRKVSK